MGLVDDGETGTRWKLEVKGKDFIASGRRMNSPSGTGHRSGEWLGRFLAAQVRYRRGEE